jgi:hypothetical protein
MARAVAGDARASVSDVDDFAVITENGAPPIAFGRGVTETSAYVAHSGGGDQTCSLVDELMNGGWVRGNRHFESVDIDQVRL